jgi:hypothetical protein
MALFKTEDHASIAKTLSNMASIYDGLGQVQEALKLNLKVYGNSLEMSFSLKNIRKGMIIHTLGYMGENTIR